ncbi:MAG: YhcH/YjgK/YiaL family protein [Dysgonamonadaceae bacterium]|jgi:YhcH/YjgK/YiaL family protein|nr:YhcH/YjgK/YiaL family protein [Dysgonamonadaceae bacterium]
MIFDANRRLAAYGSGPLWGDICRVATGMDATHPEGEFSINGKNAFYRVMSYPTKPVEVCRVEGHKEYIDIQFTLDGVERIDVFHCSATESVGPYDENNDVEFFGNDLDPIASTINLPGWFTLLFPYDLHRPQMRTAGVAKVKKAVIKLRHGVFSFRG